MKALLVLPEMMYKTEEQLLSIFQRDKQGQPAEDPSVGNSAQHGSVQLAPLIDQSAPLRSKNNNNSNNRGISQCAQNVPEGQSHASAQEQHGSSTTGPCPGPCWALSAAGRSPE